jgi:cobalt-zinc-cadmium efflux system outer membrane protein
MLSSALLLALLAQEWTESKILEAFDSQSAYSREWRARVAAAEADSVARTRYANPSVSVVREGAGRTEFYQAEQPLLVNGRRTLLRQAGGEAVQATESEGRAGLWQFRTAVRLSFYRVLALERRERILAAGLTEIGEVIRVLTIREQEGEGSRFDRIRAERERADLRSELAIARSVTEQNRAVLTAFLPAGTAVDTLTGTLAAALPAASLAEIGQRALSSRLDLRALRQRREQFRLEQRGAERLKYPDPVISAGLKRADATVSGPLGIVDRNANGLVAGISVPLPVFNKGQGETARASAEGELAEARAAILERQVLAAIEGAWRSLSTRVAALAQYERELTPGQELVRIATVAYQEGEIGILQLLDAYRTQRAALLRLLELQALTKESRIELDRAAGEEVLP